MKFEDLGLIEPLLEAIQFEGYTHPTPIQEKAIDPLLDGEDIMGCAQTGTGKTAAFALPILQRLEELEPLDTGKGGPKHPVRVLVLSPTRELAQQIDESFEAYGRYLKHRHTCIVGGVRQGPQVKALRRGVEVVIGTPGRVLDLIGQRHLDLSWVETFVLDEADRMLDMGFIEDIHKIIRRLPRVRQNLMFSATMPQSIQLLAHEILDEPVKVTIQPEAPAADTVNQKVYFVERADKQRLLEHLLSDSEQIERALVFIRTKRRADRVCMYLKGANIRAEAIHSDRTQKAREKALKDFKAGKTRVLVASDIAARGLDVDGITHVINYDMPNEPETYVHRIGRTGRAGNEGLAMSFCDVEERTVLDSIEKLIRKPIDSVDQHPFQSIHPRGNKVEPATQSVGHLGRRRRLVKRRLGRRR
ncbi:MAG: DEAD/DEAH box helicase [Phycisphaerae bacterium]